MLDFLTLFVLFWLICDELLLHLILLFFRSFLDKAYFIIKHSFREGFFGIRPSRIRPGNVLLWLEGLLEGLLDGPLVSFFLALLESLRDRPLEGRPSDGLLNWLFDGLLWALLNWLLDGLLWALLEGVQKGLFSGLLK